jgi:hypothetical protein
MMRCTQDGSLDDAMSHNIQPPSITIGDIQDDREITQLILKYLLMVAIQNNSTGLIDTVSL